jgi:hypothetical protein
MISILISETVSQIEYPPAAYHALCRNNYQSSKFPNFLPTIPLSNMKGASFMSSYYHLKAIQ